MAAIAVHSAVPRLPVSPLDPPRIARFDVMNTMDDWSGIHNKKGDYELFICNTGLEKRAGSSTLATGFGGPKDGVHFSSRTPLA
jgi:hypothetical protein